MKDLLISSPFCTKITYGRNIKDWLFCCYWMTADLVFPDCATPFYAESLIITWHEHSV